MVDERRLEELLRRVGTELGYPASTPMAPKVVARLETVGRPRRAAKTRGWAWAAVAVALTFVVVSLVPAARQAVAGWLGLGGVGIEYDPGPPPSGGAMDLGRAVTLPEATRLVDFPVLAPELQVLDGVYFDPRVPGGQVSLLFDRPATTLITQFRGNLDRELALKLIGPDSQVTVTDVGGRSAYWLEGAHAFLYLDPIGDVREETVRLAANTLLWVQDGVTIRIETSGTLTEARTLALSLASVTDGG